MLFLVASWFPFVVSSPWCHGFHPVVSWCCFHPVVSTLWCRGFPPMVSSLWCPPHGVMVSTLWCHGFHPRGVMVSTPMVSTLWYPPPVVWLLCVAFTVILNILMISNMYIITNRIKIHMTRREKKKESLKFLKRKAKKNNKMS